MSYSAIDVAYHVINYCSKKGQPISNLKLQKILYFLWIEYFVHFHEELFTDDICAWRLGPVIPSVYYEFCSYAGTSIISAPESNISDAIQKRLNSIIDQYLPIPASKLVDKTHVKGKPWDIVYEDGKGNRQVIPFSLIKELECNC